LNIVFEELKTMPTMITGAQLRNIALNIPLAQPPKKRRVPRRLERERDEA
jgi:hypothetical protein